MLRKLQLHKRLKGQSTAEYAILIALVIAAIIAMQTYAKRALQARIADATKYLVNNTRDLGNTLQFEPQYLSTDFDVTRDTAESTRLGNQETGMNSVSNIQRASGGYQKFDYNGETTLP